VGRLVHELDPRASRNELVIVDCTTITPELSGSEFFGHERGAFTGAIGMREGAFAEADGGTLFLDEVGELPPALQAQLLRVVQEGTYKRVGSNVWQRSRFRLVSATNRDLLVSIKQGRFRHDLYHRIGGWVFRVPPLRERREDILPLACHFLRTFLPDISVADFDLPVREYLLSRHYPGNVRDLRQLIARISSRHVGPGPITIGDLPDDEHPESAPSKETWCVPEFERSIAQALSLGIGLKEISQAAADAATRIAIREGNGNLRDAARRLGVTDRALQLRRAARRQHSGRDDQASK
jgi:transcriptional regulator with GAF, ATPase, and Fis domain